MIIKGIITISIRFRKIFYLTDNIITEFKCHIIETNLISRLLDWCKYLDLLRVFKLFILRQRLLNKSCKTSDHQETNPFISSIIIILLYILFGVNSHDQIN